MRTLEVLQYLKKHGQLLDSEITVGIGITGPELNKSLSNLVTRKEIFQCKLTQYKDGKPVEGLLCRVSGYFPPSTPGRKPSTSNKKPTTNI
jgi:hypothetical protein